VARTLVVLLASLVLGFPGCGESRTEPFSAEAVERAFAQEGLPLARRSIDPETDQWATLLEPADAGVRFEVQVYADSETAKNLSQAFEDFQQPLPTLSGDSRGPRFRILRRGNVVVVANGAAHIPRVERALARLSAD
jgi:hypothetical protein